MDNARDFYSLNVGSIPAGGTKDIVMYKVNEKELPTLEEALEYAKSLGVFVSIVGNGMEIVGKFGVDEIVDGMTPDGHEYSWVKRRHK